MVKYIIRAALAEEANDGWVWICGPSTNGLDSRTVVQISQPGRCYKVYTEVRTIDCNFLRQYNVSPRIAIDREKDTIVMAEWYRRTLAISATSDQDNKTGNVSLIIKKAKIPVWRSVRAACHHPDPVVRLGTRLGILGTWLGILGVWLGLLGAFAMAGTARLWGFGVLVLLVGGLAVWAAWGPPRPRLE